MLTHVVMDHDEDLLAWTRELSYPGASDAESGNHCPAPTGRKRQHWNLEGCQPKRAATADKPEMAEKPSPTDDCHESGESSLQLWPNDVMENATSATFDANLNYNISDTLLESPSLSVFKQEGVNGDSTQSMTDHDSGVTLQRLLQGATYFSRPEHDSRFQYVLAAATSIASKQGEETLTYLNQRQSYGIKLKKVGELLAFKGKLLKSVIRLQFHERRLQFSEKEQILAWQATRPGERIVELDVPLSYGLFDVEHDTVMVNTLSFCWDPTQEVGAYIKVNSISTEFTPKKHGGEKGVPFRIQVETYIQGDSFPLQPLHAAACQIRVFKLKGADRKHKQERERWLKLGETERGKYQPPYESTVLTDLALDTVIAGQPFISNGDPVLLSSPRQTPASGATTSRGARHHHGSLLALPNVNDIQSKIEEARSPSARTSLDSQSPEFCMEMGREQVVTWMVRNGMEMLSNTFLHFNGVDMLRLTRQDLVTMCGLSHGTRLYYALRSKPAITVYVSLPGNSWFHPVYLQKTSVAELASKLGILLDMTEVFSSTDIYLSGPNGIHVLITDELLGNLVTESSFTLQLINANQVNGGGAAERCCVLLTHTNA